MQLVCDEEKDTAFCRYRGTDCIMQSANGETVTALPRLVTALCSQAYLSCPLGPQAIPTCPTVSDCNMQSADDLWACFTGVSRSTVRAGLCSRWVGPEIETPELLRLDLLFGIELEIS